jgi:hypothetical protein
LLKESKQSIKNYAGRADVGDGGDGKIGMA